MRQHALVAAIAAALFPACVLGAIEKLSVLNDGRMMFTIDTFGFDDGGKISLEMKDLAVMVDGKSVSPEGDIGILVSNVDTEIILKMEETIDLCLIDQPGLDILESWQIDLPLTKPKKMETTIPAGMANEYSIFYYNCKSGATVNFDLDIELYNVNNGKKDYLPVGESSLPNVWFGFSFVFFLGLLWWGNHLKAQWDNKHAIHVLMTVLLVLKVMTMAVDGLKLSHMKATGTGSAWDWIWFMLYGVKGAALFIVIVLIGSGWSFVKPFLQEKEKKIVMIILPLQVINNIALAVTEEENQGSQGWATWRDILHLFDIICCCAILFPIVWSIKHLREASATDGKAAVNMEKLTLFRQFYMMVVSYIYFTRIIVFLLGSTLPFRWAWISTAATQGATLLFYAVTGYKFRPMRSNPYLRVSQEDEDEIRQFEMDAMEEGRNDDL